MIGQPYGNNQRGKVQYPLLPTLGLQSLLSECVPESVSSCLRR